MKNQLIIIACLLCLGPLSLAVNAQEVASAAPTGAEVKAAPPTGIQAFLAKPQLEFVVGSVSRDFDDVDWDDQVIAIGIRSLLVEEFKANPRFVNVEDNAEINEAVHKFVQANWFGKELPQEQQLGALPAFTDKLIVNAKLTEFSKKRVSSFGFGMGSAYVSISVKLVLDFTLNGEKVYETFAWGTGRTEQESVIFQISDDAITFDATTVGTAVRKAVQTAVVKSIKDLGI